MMKNPTAQALQSIRNLEDLVRFLRDELDWPVQVEEFDLEDAFFEFDPSELGIAEEHATKIRAIRRLRPLPNLPFGIHFVDFEEGPLPVVALRRVLNAVVKKKKARGDIATFEMDDLLFVSSHGQDDSRAITFANFTARPDGRLPVLKVLGWDEDDPKLALEHTAQTLLNCLRWPDESNDPDAWRDLWRSAFTRQYRETIRDSKRLAKELAILASKIRDALRKALSIESEDGPLRQILSAFQTTLLDDLDEDQFSDMYAQTIAYGLLSARMTDPEGRGAGQLAEAMPSTNPFLKELMQTFLEAGASSAGGLDFDELGIDDVVSLLNSCDMPAVVRDFGHKNPQEDPVIHFFEGFLQEYDSQIRKDRGVFYTPRPVVSFIVRSVDELLRTEFGLEDGLADTTTWGEMAGRIDDLEIPEGATSDQAFVQILDPATGTGTFLVEVIELIHKTMTAKWQAEGHGKKKIEKLWNDYVPEHLLPRLHGYELMMAPYAIAHMKIGLKLFETGYRFESDERARVYLTNALEPAQDFSGTLAFAIPALAHEAEAVNAIKRDQRFTVVIGNPPYSGVSSNTGEWITELVRDYYFVDSEPLGERNPKWLQDDYVKFIRLGQLLLSTSRMGAFSFITNHSYIDNPTFRGFRYSFSRQFPSLRVLDLHGNTKKRERAPDGTPDANIFDIQQGVALFVACSSGEVRSRIQHGDLYGSRQEKYERLIASDLSSLNWTAVSCDQPYFLLTPQSAQLRDEYEAWGKITDIMQTNGWGIATRKDYLLVDFDHDDLRSRFDSILGGTLENAYRMGIQDNRNWSFASVKERVGSATGDRVVPYAYRPFDLRSVFYEPLMIERGDHRWPIARHLFGVDGNLSLLLSRTGAAAGSPEWDVLFVADGLSDLNLFRRGGAFIFPLYLVHDESELGFDKGKSPNLSEEFMGTVSVALRDGEHESGASTVSPEECFHYIYALLHSPGYRRRYADFLSIDFPRLPIGGSQKLLRELIRMGSDLVGLHLLQAPLLDDHRPSLIGTGDFQVEKVSYSDETVWIDKAKTRGFKGVPEEVWKFHIGGYQVCEKWLKDRQAKGGKNPRLGRVLTDEDIEHYQKIVFALSETIRIMGEIDKVIEEHGGWPGAFQTGGE